MQRHAAEKARQLSDDNSWTAPGVGAIITVEGKRRRLNGGTAGHKSWEKHAWQNCHGPTLRSENMSPSTSVSPSISSPFSPSSGPVHPLALALAHRRPSPSLAPFAVLRTLRNCQVRRHLPRLSCEPLNYIIAFYEIFYNAPSLPSTVLVRTSIEIENEKSDFLC